MEWTVTRLNNFPRIAARCDGLTGNFLTDILFAAIIIGWRNGPMQLTDEEFETGSDAAATRPASTPAALRLPEAMPTPGSVLGRPRGSH